MHLRTVAMRPGAAALGPVGAPPRTALDDVLAHLVAALAIGSGLLLVPTGVGGVPLLATGATGASAFEAWTLIRTTVALQVGIAVLAIGLGAVARTRGPAGTRAERWCVVAAMSAAIGVVLLVVPPI
ncbi:hypothetical protein C5C27_06310 [Rathayibacter sp. AY2B7]|uniref:hypothetical protein n=1 Tax=Rathayibacter sp. AY2B7 TaxID=2080571 RepID=UPI000CE73848|nr:hypothetical protein [Rathayibacter sp. AY2B7]PPG63072.1 hypothetical protein C5C27_06310 [Rathayibacter sp. AY2B7]